MLDNGKSEVNKKKREKCLKFMEGEKRGREGGAKVTSFCYHALVVQLPLKDNEQVNQRLLTFPQILTHRHTQQILLLRF